MVIAKLMGPGSARAIVEGYSSYRSRRDRQFAMHRWSYGPPRQCSTLPRTAERKDIVKRPAIIMPVVALLLTSCGSSDLDRGDAAALIERSAEFAQPVRSVGLVAGGFEEGHAQGFWDADGNPIPKTERPFARRASAWNLELLGPLSRKVSKITGIAPAISSLGGEAAGGMKEAQFTWEYSNVHGFARRFLVRGGTGVAVLRSYDDGWRVEDVKIEEGKEGFMLTSTEREAAAQARLAEQDRRRQEEKRLA